MKEGDKAPDFELKNQHGEKLRLYDLLKESPVVLFFYPKDNTPGCTKEVCAFRDSHEAFTDLGATVLGISSDGESSHKQFSQKHNLPFQLLSDRSGGVRKKFGVPRTWGLLPGRVTYVIDQEGVIRYLFNSAFKAEQHMENSLKAVRKMMKAKA